MQPIIVLETAAKFFNTIRITGWIKTPVVARTIALQSTSIRDQITELHPPDNNGLQRFILQLLNEKNVFDWGAQLVGKSEDGSGFSIQLKPAIHEALIRASGTIDRSWQEALKASQTILDIGGRARSRIDRSLQYPGKHVTVFDVLPGDNVDVVGDAHELSNHFPSDTFDAAYSVSVFEHLLQPWKVVLEINKILRPGGTVLIHTHQTLGMHDMPWDFLRFSIDAWDGFFNQKTGFEIIERAARQPSYIVPFVMREGKETAENSAGFEGSTVLARKIGPYDPALNWPVATRDAIQTIYPTD